MTQNIFKQFPANTSPRRNFQGRYPGSAEFLLPASTSLRLGEKLLRRIDYKI
jgi:hypothetical protein